MLIDDHQHFVELTVDGIMCGKVKYDVDFFTSTNKSQQFQNANILIIDWMGERKDQESDKFKELTRKLFAEFIASRASQVLHGEINDDGLEKENVTLKTKIKTLESENKQAVEQLSQVKEELDVLQDAKPVDKGFHGFK